ncbi:hypothetical protein PZH42_31175, partial [Bacteroides cellulosilyticus]|nr:hypothetical protein [Bacteroides cellulosilyticus]
MATILSVVAAMIILAYAGNKVEGMALVKVSALVMVGLIIPFVITDSTQYIFSFLPSFWIATYFTGLTICMAASHKQIIKRLAESTLN